MEFFKKWVSLNNPLCLPIPICQTFWSPNVYYPAHRGWTKALMYLATKYQWRYVLNYHAACLMEIERGHLKWGDSFQMLQCTTLAGGILLQPSNQNRGGASGSRSAGQFGKEGGTVFCRFYQRGTCSHTDDHQGLFNGETRLLRHICAKCWLSGKKIEVHPESSVDCPSK